jgi:hypothetical protein
MVDHLSSPHAIAGALLLLSPALGPRAPCAAVPLADPMRPSYFKPAPGSAGNRAYGGGPQLQAVFGDATTRIAIISGQVVTVGSRVGALAVASIGPRSVELRNGAQSLRLSLAGASQLSGGESP